MLAKLEEKKLKPASAADRRTLLRRLSYDLTGLPPTFEEVDDFIKDKRPDAYAGVIKRLLASRIMANVGEDIGLMSHAMQIRRAIWQAGRSAAMPFPILIEIMSSRPSTTTNPTISLSSNKSLPTNCLPVRISKHCARAGISNSWPTVSKQSKRHNRRSN